MRRGRQRPLARRHKTVVAVEIAHRRIARGVGMMRPVRCGWSRPENPRQCGAMKLVLDAEPQYAGSLKTRPAMVGPCLMTAAPDEAVIAESDRTPRPC